jgi:cytosine/adenosine deaminase-related metal-dependent hydrolase
MSGLDEIPEMLACATWRRAKTLGLEDEYGIEEGKLAHLVSSTRRRPSRCCAFSRCAAG